MEKIKTWVKETFVKTKNHTIKTGKDVCVFADEHPFLFGWMLGTEIIYWYLVIYALFHPKKKLDWVDIK